jgi:hypothetical protein
MAQTPLFVPAPAGTRALAGDLRLLSGLGVDLVVVVTPGCGDG